MTTPSSSEQFPLIMSDWLYRESRTTWDQEIRDDVIEECNKHGGVLHLYVDKASPQGNVYVKCPTISAAVASVRALHGRYFGGKTDHVIVHHINYLHIDGIQA